MSATVVPRTASPNVEGRGGFDVIAFARTLLIAPASAEQVGENVTESSRSSARSRTGTTGTSSPGAARKLEIEIEALSSGPAEWSACTTSEVERLAAYPVVLRTLLLVIEHRVGLGDLLESLLCFLVVGIDVRVVLAGELPVSLLDLFFGGVFLDAQDVVITTICHHVNSISRPSRKGHSSSGIMVIASDRISPHSRSLCHAYLLPVILERPGSCIG